MRKLFAIVMSMLMIACFMPTMAFASETPAKTWQNNGKFKVALTSGATTATAEVYDDYSVFAKVNGNTVDASGVKLKVEMKNVASLGVGKEETRKYEKTFSTGITNKATVSLPQHFPNLFKFTGATVNGKVDDKEFSYTVSKFDSKGSEGSPSYELTATPSDYTSVHDAWWTLTGKVNAVQDNVDDSKIVIPEGAYLQIGTEKIRFAKECTINPSDASATIETGTVVSETGATLTGDMKAELYLPAGTVLKLSSSTATLKNSIYVRTDVVIPDDQVKALKSSIASDDQNKLYGILLNLVNLTDATIKGIDGKTVNVHVLNKFDVTIDGAKKEYAYGDTFNLASAGAGYVWKDQDGKEVEEGTVKVASDMTLTKTKVSSSGGSSGGYVAPVTPTTDNVTNTTEDKKTDTSAGTGTTVATTTATVKAETKTAADGTKTVAATVDTTTATKIVEKAVENKSEEVVVNTATTAAVTETAAGTTTKVDLPEQTVKAIAEKTEAAVTIKSDAAEIKLDTEAVKAVAEQAGDTGTVNLVVETVAQNETKVEVNLKLVTSKGNVSDFKGGNVSVTVKLNTKLAAKPVVCVYIDDNGTYHKVKGVKNADGTFTFTTGHFSSYAVMEEEEADKVIAEQTAKVEKMVKALSLKARSAKTEKGNIKVTLKVDSDAIKAIEDLGYTVKYKFYRSAKKAKGYKVAVEKAGKTYINTTGKKGTKYYYKAKVMVYDAQGELIAKSALTQCKYASRTR